MGYLLELRPLSVDALTAALTAELPPGHRSGAGTVAAALARRLAPLAGSLDHSSAAGSWFRDELIGRRLAEVIGATPAAHLLNRPVDGFSWSGYPSLGWLSHAEIDSVLRTAIRPIDADDDESDHIATVLSAFTRAADAGTDLVTVYM